MSAWYNKGLYTPKDDEEAKTGKRVRNEMRTRVYLVEDGAGTLEETLLHVLSGQSARLQEH